MNWKIDTKLQLAKCIIGKDLNKIVMDKPFNIN